MRRWISKAIALATAGAVGSDLANMVNEAAILAVKAWKKCRISEQIYRKQSKLVEMGKEKKNKILSEKEREIVSYHEVGHALVSALQKDAEPVQKITIVPRTIRSTRICHATFRKRRNASIPKEELWSDDW